MTSNHTTEPSEEDRELLARQLEEDGDRDAAYYVRDRQGTKVWAVSALRAIAKARSPSPDDRMGEVLRYALRPFANAAEKCRTPIAGDAAKWLAWDDFEVARNVLANTRLAASREGGEMRGRIYDLLESTKEPGDWDGSWAMACSVIWARIAALASPAPMQMLVDGEWLKNKITTDPDSECEVRPAPMPEKLTVEDIERETLDLMAEASKREGAALHQWISARIDAAALGSAQDKEI